MCFLFLSDLTHLGTYVRILLNNLEFAQVVLIQNILVLVFFHLSASGPFMSWWSFQNNSVALIQAKAKPFYLLINLLSISFTQSNRCFYLAITLFKYLPSKHSLFLTFLTLLKLLPNLQGCLELPVCAMKTRILNGHTKVTLHLFYHCFC